MTDGVQVPSVEAGVKFAGVAGSQKFLKNGRQQLRYDQGVGGIFRLSERIKQSKIP